MTIMKRKKKVSSRKVMLSKIIKIKNKGKNYK